MSGINTKIYTLLIASLVHQIYMIENTAEYGGAVYIADESNSGLCNSFGFISLQMECFIQIFAVFSDQLNDTIRLQRTTLKLLYNNATVAGEAIFGGLFDRCTVSQLNPKCKLGLTQSYLHLKSISNINSTDLMASNPV